MDGIPAVVLGEAASKFVSVTKIEDIENLTYPDREDWIKNIMWNQFLRTEISSGKALEILKKRNGLK